MSQMRREYIKNRKKLISEDYQEDVEERDAWWEVRDQGSAEELRDINNRLKSIINNLVRWNDLQARYAAEYEDEDFELLCEEPATAEQLKIFYDRIEKIKEQIDKNDYLR